MAKLFKNSKQILALVIAFAVLAVSLFAGSIVVSAEEGTEVTTTPLCSNSVVYWDGTTGGEQITIDNDGTITKNTLADDEEEGSVDDPIIIDDAEELNYLANYAANQYSAGKFATKDTYYKMADGIGYMILQPQGKLDLDRLFACEDGQAVADYFAEIGFENLANWSSKDGEMWFAGHFDGNGVIFAGMYSASRSAGLFPTADGTAVFENLAVVNSYIYGNGGNARTGSIVGGTCGIKYGVNVAGVVTFENIIVANNYLKCVTNTSNGAIVMGACNSQDIVNINNAVVYGNASEVAGTPNNMHLYNGHTEHQEINKVTNSVILGTTPYIKSSYNSNTGGKDCFENVITDAEIKWHDKAQYEDKNMKSVAGLSEYAIVKEYTKMFTLFHGAIEPGKNATTHHYACKTCGFKFFGDVIHNWNENFDCVDCEQHCEHSNKLVGQVKPGGCVEQDYVYSKCQSCTWEEGDYVGTPQGHVLEWVDEIEATCEHEDGGHEGRQGYWHCTVCDGNFAADSEEAAKWTSMDKNIVNPDVELIIPFKPHNAENTEKGYIQIYDKDNEGHYWVCYTCEGYLKAVETKRASDEIKTVEHEYEDGVCKECGWECPEHEFDENDKEIVVVGDCYTDRVEQVSCTNCEMKKTTVIPTGHDIQPVEEKAPTETKEGKKAHYACTVCKEEYTDAAGTTKALAADLVIPRVLPKEYQNMVLDTNGKSPNTNDSFASVVAFAAIAGAALVLARKVK